MNKDMTQLNMTRNSLLREKIKIVEIYKSDLFQLVKERTGCLKLIASKI